MKINEIIEAIKNLNNRAEFLKVLQTVSDLAIDQACASADEDALDDARVASMDDDLMEAASLLQEAVEAYSKLPAE